MDKEINRELIKEYLLKNINYCGILYQQYSRKHGIISLTQWFKLLDINHNEFSGWGNYSYEFIYDTYNRLVSLLCEGSRQ